eukprot:6206546-Pleurochrysis_carterae.AAC.2
MIFNLRQRTDTRKGIVIMQTRLYLLRDVTSAYFAQRHLSRASAALEVPGFTPPTASSTSARSRVGRLLLETSDGGVVVHARMNLPFMLCFTSRPASAPSCAGALAQARLNKSARDVLCA